MKIPIVATALMLCLVTLCAAQSKPKIDDLNWIAGCWEVNRPERKSVIAEQWMSPSGGAMIGMGRTVRDGKMTEFEFLRIVDDGTAINYIAKPSANKDETPFKLVKWSAGE